MLYSSKMAKAEFVEMRQKISESHYGQILNNSPHWNRFNLDNLPLSEWQKILGYDANNLQHMRFTYYIANAFVDLQNQKYPGYFSQNEKEILLTAASIHDLPEAITGDVNYDFKTEKDDEIEFKNMFVIMENISIGIDRQTTHQIINILKDKTTKLGEAFNATENIGYFKTCIKAYKKTQKSKLPANTINNLQWLSSNVLTGRIPQLINYSSKFVLPEYSLLRYKTEVSDALNKLPLTNCFDFYSESERQGKIDQFQLASTKWSNWLSQKL